MSRVVGFSDITEATKAFQRGEEAAFTFFYNSLWGALHYYAYRILDDRDEAKDKVDESFVKIWKRHSSFHHPQVIKSWLYTTVRNACLNHIQQEKRQGRHKDLMAVEQTEIVQPVIHDIIRAELAADVHKYIKALPTECRKVFTALYIEGKTVADIAKETMLSISTVKNQKARGLKIIRKIVFAKKVEAAPPPPPAPVIEKVTLIIPMTKKKEKEKKARNRPRKYSWEKVNELRETLKPKEIAKIMQAPVHSIL